MDTDTKQDYFETRCQFYEQVLSKYKTLLRIIENENISRLSDLVKRIDEAFTDNMYPQAMTIYEEFVMIKDDFDRTKDFPNYVKNRSSLKFKMAKLDGNYETKVSIWMEQLQNETDLALKKGTLSQDKANEIIKLTEQLSLSKYYTNSHAVIIGIDHYQNENRLANAMNDARSMTSILQEKYNFDNITKLYEENATKSNIQRVLDDFLQDRSKIKRDDRVMLYFSGHGKLRIDEAFGGEQITQGYLLPFDAEKDSYASYIKMDDVVKACQNCIAKHVLLVLDCCYSGYAALKAVGDKEKIGGKSTEEYLGDITSRRAIQVIAAGQEDQPVSDSGLRPGHSAFTGALLDILEESKDIDDDGLLTAAEIGLSIRGKVANHLGGHPIIQVPVYLPIVGSLGGDFVFKILPARK